MIILKLLILPCIAVLTLLQWVGLFLTQFMGMLFQVLAGGIFLLGLACWVTGLESSSGVMNIMAISFTFYVLPMIAEQLLIWLVLANGALKDLLRA